MNASSGDDFNPAAVATIALLSTPPDRNAPSGTSATRQSAVASRSRSRSSTVACASSICRTLVGADQ